MCYCCNFYCKEFAWENKWLLGEREILRRFDDLGIFAPNFNALRKVWLFAPIFLKTLGRVWLFAPNFKMIRQVWLFAPDFKRQSRKF